MTIAEQIDQQYGTYQEKVFARQAAQRKIAADIASGFVTYLGLSPNAWFDDHGNKRGTRIELGLGQGESFSATPWMSLPINKNGEVEFAISYVLVGHRGNYTLTYDLRLAVTPEGYEVTVGHIAPSVALSSYDVDTHSYDELYSLMVEALRSKIDPDAVILHL